MAAEFKNKDRFMANRACLDLMMKLLKIRSQLLEGDRVQESIEKELAALDFYAGLKVFPDTEFARAIFEYFDGTDDELDFDELCEKYLGQALPTDDPTVDKERELIAMLKRFDPSGKPQ